MIAEISAGLGSLKAAFDITKGLNAASTQATVNEVKIPLQQHIIEAQQALSAANDIQSATAERIRELEKDIMRLKDWSAEKERYQLVNVWQGTVAYMPKSGMENGEPAHWLCSNCFSHGQKSFLSNQGQVGPNAVWKCGGCKSGMTISARTKPDYGNRA